MFLGKPPKSKEERLQDQVLRQQKKEAKRLAKSEAKALEKSRLAELKKDKEEVYVLRKNQTLKIGRWALWLMLGFIFIKGVVVSVRPDPTTEVHQMISKFKTSLESYQDQDNEVLSFAKNFVRDYLTYSGGNESDYVNRLKKYSAESVYNLGYQFQSGTSAKVTYVDAYRKEVYSDHQMDVYVIATIDYTQRKQEGETITDHKSTGTTILKVPISYQNNRYLVEDLPVFVSDETKLTDYQAVQYAGLECPSDITDAIQLALTNFYSAYYGQEQSVINYFLDPSADQSEFMGLSGRVTFNRIEAIRAYYPSDETTTEFVVLVTLSVVDNNGVSMLQKFNLKLNYKDNQYYVVDMDTRHTNLN